MGYIYLITNKINGQQYVGQTIREDIETRWKQHRETHKNAIGRYLYSAYKKYGIENFKFQIICVCFDEDCNKFEEEYIKKCNTLAPNGYNLQSGGSNWHHHPDTIAKLKKSLKGKPGIIQTAEWRETQRVRMTGVKNPNYGKKMSEEQKEKIRATRRKRMEESKEKGEETIKKCIEGLDKGRAKLIEMGKYYKKVGKYNKAKELIESFESISDASRKTGITFSNISRVCLGKPHCKTAGGFVWKFL